MKSFLHFFIGITSLFTSITALAQSTNTTVSKKSTLPKTFIAMNASPDAGAKPTAGEAVLSETKDFKGTVVDEIGEPLAGAVVSVVVGKDRFSVTTTTNADGEYVLRSLVASPLLLVSYAGYVEIQQKATYAQPITFQLEPVENYERQLVKQSKVAGKAWRN